MGIDGTTIFAITPPRVTKYLSGSGVHTMSAGAVYAFVEVLGAGASGSGGGLTPSLGISGTQSSFDTILAGGGLAPTTQILGGAGGGPSGGTGWTIMRFIYGSSGNSGGTQLVTFGIASGKGGDSFYNGGGASTTSGLAGGSAALNSGSGGAGGSASTGVAAAVGGGGGAGAYIKAVGYGIGGLSFNYVVGNGGASASGGTGGAASGSGANGIIIVHECFQ